MYVWQISRPQEMMQTIAATKKVEEALGDNGRILLRESGTEPVIRVMVEADTEELCNRYVDDVIKVLEEKGHVVEK